MMMQAIRIVVYKPLSKILRGFMVRLTASSYSVLCVLRESQYLLLLPLLLSIKAAPLYYCTAALLLYLKRLRVYAFAFYQVRVPVRTSTSECGMRAVCISMHERARRAR